MGRGDPLFTIHAESPGELDYARAYLANNPIIIDVDEGMPAISERALERG